MRDYKVYLPHHRELQRLQDEKIIDRTSAVLSLVVLVGLIGLVCYSCVDAVVTSAEIQERFYSAPVAATFERPSAFRLASPTPDQMDHLHHVQQIAQVRR